MKEEKDWSIMHVYIGTISLNSPVPSMFQKNLFLRDGLIAITNESNEREGILLQRRLNDYAGGNE